MPRYSLYIVLTTLVFVYTLIDYKGLSMLYLDIFSLALYSLISVIYQKKISRQFEYLMAIMIVVLILEIAAYLMGVTYRNNHPVYHLTVPVQLLIYGIFFGQSLFYQRNKYFFILLFSLIGLSILNTLFLQNLWTAPSNGMILLALFVITCSLFQFKTMLKTPSTEKLRDQPIFWFTMGSFIFYTLNFVAFGLHAVLTSDLPDFIFDFVMWLNIFLYFSYFVAIYLSSLPKTEKS